MNLIRKILKALMLPGDYFSRDLSFLPIAMSASADPAVGNSKETAVKNLIHAYRSRAHLKSDTNPVRDRRNHDIKLDLDHFGLSSADLETPFQVGNEIGLGAAKLKDIVTRLKKIYLGSIGYEYSHLREPHILAWFRSKCETEGRQH